MKFLQKSILCANTLSWLKIFADYGLDREIIIKKAHIDPRLLDDPDAHIPFFLHMRLLNEGIQQIDDPAIGLHIAERIQLEELGIIGQLILNSRNAREAFFQMKRYSNLAVDNLRWELKEVNDKAIFTQHETGDHPIWARERVFAGIISFITKLSGEKVKAIEVRFQHAAPHYIQEYVRIFGCSPLFSQAYNSLVFESRYLDLPLPNYSQYLSALINRHAETLVSEINRFKPFHEQVKRLILEKLHTGLVDIIMICDELRISRWTLARNLRSESTTFKDILMDTKKQLIMKYLRSGMHPIHEIALLTGFKSQGAFYQFFKNWTGKSPRKYIGSDFTKSLKVRP